MTTGMDGQMTRTDAICEAIRRVVEARRAEIDAAVDLRAVTIDVKIPTGGWKPRAVILQLERETVFPVEKRV